MLWNWNFSFQYDTLKIYLKQFSIPPRKSSLNIEKWREEASAVGKRKKAGLCWPCSHVRRLAVEKTREWETVSIWKRCAAFCYGFWIERHIFLKCDGVQQVLSYVFSRGRRRLSKRISVGVAPISRNVYINTSVLKKGAHSCAQQGGQRTAVSD